MTLPDAEQTLAALVEQMRGAVAFDARFVGIYSGGAWLADRLAEAIPGDHGVGYIDVSYYRDDFNRTGLKPAVRTSEIPFEIEGATIVLVDDGRPAVIELAVLVDRGGRELPIEANWAGARLVVARDVSIVLSRDAGGRLALSTEPAPGTGGG